MKLRRVESLRLPQSGQSLPEFLVAIPLFLFLLLLIFQLVLVYRAKTTLDYAALEAARAGAVSGVDMSEMNGALAKGLAPLYATDPGVSGLASALLRANVDMLLNARIEIISPTQEAWDAYNEPQYNGQRALPNDNLAFRPAEVRGGGVSVQDANILKIKVDYDFPLIVPFVDRVLRGDSRFIKSDGLFDPANVDMKYAWLGGTRHFRIPLQSQAIVRMQSPIYNRDALSNAVAGEPGPGGPGDPGPGGPDPGNPDPGNPGPVNPDPGNPFPGLPDPGNPDPETPQPGNPDWPGWPDPDTDPPPSPVEPPVCTGD
ncbi:MAG: TadE/TadG family type IV pilus assembly protein [Luteimonas sp.]